MSSHRPEPNDDRRVREALRALADETSHLVAPAAVEARLRESFRGAAPALAPRVRDRKAWAWMATLGAAAALAWLAFAGLRGEAPRAGSGRQAHTDGAAAAPSPAADHAPPIRLTTRPEAPGRVAAAAPRSLRVRPPRREPATQHFEALYPGDPLADLDAVHLVRVSVPRSALASMGWPARGDLGGRDRVELDAVVGPDGVARAVRFVNR